MIVFGKRLGVMPSYFASWSLLNICLSAVAYTSLRHDAFHAKLQ
jgi:hypothetical protein